MAVKKVSVVLAESVGLQDAVITSFAGAGGGGKKVSVVLAESVGLQDAVITSFSGAGGGGKKVSVVLAESVGLQDSIATPTIGVQHPPVVLAESVGLQDDVTTSLVTVGTAAKNVTAIPGDAQVALSWQAPVSNGGSPITNYKIYRSLTSGVETLLTTVGNVTSFTDTGLTNGQTYFYKVTAVNLVGESPRSNEASATPAKAGGNGGNE